MEKACEFCAIHRPMVYCKSDAAYLCLSCDAKVHSANALSNRHFRALVCESCKEEPAIVRCLGHRMLLCHGCDRGLHDRVSSFHHQKHAISSYAGCPSARQFASIWGFDADEFLVYGSTSLPDDSSSARVSSPRGSLDRGSRGEMRRFGASSSQIGVSSLGSASSSVVVCLESTPTPSGSQHSKMLRKDQSTSLIKQQILDLRRLQIDEGNNNNNIGSPLICRRGRRQQQTTSSTAPALKRLDEDNIALFHNLEHDLDCLGEPDNLDPKADRFLSPVSQWDHLSCPATGDPFWQCESSIEDGQFWSQSLEELETCGEGDRFDDLINIPDVDMTFRNFEELFAGGQGLDRGPLQGFDATSLSFGKNDRSDNNSRTGGRIASSSIHANSSAHEGRHIDPSNQARQFSKSMENPDDGDDPPLTTEGWRLQPREDSTTRSKEGKKARLHVKQIPSDARKRIRDRQQLALHTIGEGYESNQTQVTRRR